MTVLLGLIIFWVGGTLGLFIGCALGLSGRLDLYDDLEEMESEIDALRGRG